ncbi:hypothetical protein Daus18300_007468 [Diaporthe australafricana]|uniref:J domain-containing protein n=1 Tax=Diaporthe australafricana TaxID=127596 RepID=A0ABR3WMM3_9PEZI
MRFSSNGGKGNGKKIDPYKVLGVSAVASQETIKSTYYRECMKSHPDAIKRMGDPDADKKSERFLEVQAAYDIIDTPEKRACYDAAILEEERQARRAQAAAAAATPQPAQATRAAEHRETSRMNSQASSSGANKFARPGVQDWITRHRKLKEEADAQREKNLAAQREKNLAARRAKDEAVRKHREWIAQAQREQCDREAALRDREKPKTPARPEKVNGRPAKKQESKEEHKQKPSPEDEKGADGVRVAIFRVQNGTQIPDLEKALASSAVGAVADFQIPPSGAARLEFLNPDGAHKLQDLIRGRRFMVNGKPVEEVTLQATGQPLPQDPLASRCLMLVDLFQKMPIPDENDFRFLFRQNRLDCSWIGVRRLSRKRTEIRFSSWQDAAKAKGILDSQFPYLDVRYALDPATGNSESLPTLQSLLTGEALPAFLWKYMRDCVVVFCILVSISTVYNFSRQKRFNETKLHDQNADGGEEGKPVHEIDCFRA